MNSVCQGCRYFRRHLIEQPENRRETRVDQMQLLIECCHAYYLIADHGRTDQRSPHCIENRRAKLLRNIHDTQIRYDGLVRKCARKRGFRVLRRIDIGQHNFCGEHRFRR